MLYIAEGDQPSPNMVIARTKNGFFYLKNNRKVTGIFIPLGNFGFKITLIKGGVHCEKIRESKAVYRDKQPRDWQSDITSFDLFFDILGVLE